MVYKTDENRDNDDGLPLRWRSLHRDATCKIMITDSNNINDNVVTIMTTAIITKQQYQQPEQKQQ